MSGINEPMALTVEEFDSGLHFICMSAEEFGYYRETGEHEAQLQRKAKHDQLLAAYRDKCAEVERLKVEREQEMIRCAACLTAAEGHRTDPPLKQGDYAWTPAYQHTLELRADRDEARFDRAELLELLEKAFEGYIDVNTAFYEDVQAALVKYDA